MCLEDVFAQVSVFVSATQPLWCHCHCHSVTFQSSDSLCQAKKLNIA